MDKNEIIKIFGDWNFWYKDLNAGINRPYYLNKIKKLNESSHIIVITGARRSGKSFIMRQTAKTLIKGGVRKNNILIVNFEDPRFVELNTKILQQLYDVYLEFLNPQEKPYLFLDEIQEVKDWEKWVRMIHELDKAKIIISGSNAKLLSRELSTLLTGRHLDLVIFPLSFKEFLRFRNVDLPKRFKIRKSKELVSLAKFYLGNISSLITFGSLERTLNISVDTVEKFSRYLEDTFILFFLKRFSYKFGEQEKSPRKVYAIDVGLANTIGFRFSQNMWRLAENLVFLELKRKEMLNSNLEIYYWKDVNHREVDFLIKENLKVKQLIQVCWEVNRPETKNREIRALLKAMKEFNLEEGLIITDDYEAEENIKGKKINNIPLWKWYLKEGK